MQTAVSIDGSYLMTAKFIGGQAGVAGDSSCRRIAYALPYAGRASVAAAASDIDGTVGLGFLDLIEARFVDAFRRASVPWAVIRRCAEQARVLIGSDHRSGQRLTKIRLRHRSETSPKAIGPVRKRA